MKWNEEVRASEEGAARRSEGRDRTRGKNRGKDREAGQGTGQGAGQGAGQGREEQQSGRRAVEEGAQRDRRKMGKG